MIYVNRAIQNMTFRKYLLATIVLTFVSTVTRVVTAETTHQMLKRHFVPWLNRKTKKIVKNPNEPE